jgi:hypothetical protein
MRAKRWVYVDAGGDVRCAALGCVAPWHGDACFCLLPAVRVRMGWDGGGGVWGAEARAVCDVSETEIRDLLPVGSVLDW